MHELEELKARLCDELKRYGERDLSAGSLDVIDKLAHAAKNIDKLIDGYSMRHSYNEQSYRNRDDRSYGRDSMGRYSSRRYSRDGMADKLRELVESAPDERAKDELRKLADKMESM